MPDPFSHFTHEPWPEELHGGTTTIVPMPHAWFTEEERLQTQRELFYPRERQRLIDIGQFNRRWLKNADAIVVYLPVPPGYLGDDIEASRLIELMETNFGDKVFLQTDRPDLFTSSRVIEQIYEEGRGYNVVYTDSDGRQQRRNIRGYFMVGPTSEWLHSGTFVSRTRVTRQEGLEFDLDKFEHTHNLHVAQVVWEMLYGVPIDTLPKPRLRLSPQNYQEAQVVIDAFGVSDDLNLVIHPDAHETVYFAKQWEPEKWLALCDKVLKTHPKARIFISHGQDHPELSQALALALQTRGYDQVKALPSLPLPTYAALLDILPKNNTVFVGLESMPAGHLAPGLGLKSIVLSYDQAYFRHYGPWNGFSVVYSDPVDQYNPNKGTIATRGVTVDAVFNAIDMALEELG